MSNTPAYGKQMPSDVVQLSKQLTVGMRCATRAIKNFGVSVKQAQKGLACLGRAMTPFFEALKAQEQFDKLSRERQVAVRLRFGKNLLAWWVEERIQNA